MNLVTTSAVVVGRAHSEWDEAPDLARLKCDAAVKLVQLRYASNVRIPHEISVRILQAYYADELRFRSRYVRWQVTDHSTLGLVVEDIISAHRWIWAVGFSDCKPRRLAKAD